MAKSGVGHKDEHDNRQGGASVRRVASSVSTTRAIPTNVSSEVNSLNNGILCKYSGVFTIKKIHMANESKE